MPRERCFANGQPGYRWGSEGKCYTYPSGDKEAREAAKEKADKQGRAIEASKHSGS